MKNDERWDIASEASSRKRRRGRKREQGEERTLSSEEAAAKDAIEWKVGVQRTLTSGEVAL